MAHLPDAREKKRLAELKKEVARPGYDRHASRLGDVSELPTDLQSSSLAVLVGQEAVQDIHVFPAQIQRGWHYVPKQALLFTATGVIHLLASIWPEQEPQVTSLDGCGLMYLKASLLLLYGYLEIVAPSQDSLIRLGMEFNTVAWSAISAPLRQLLRISKTAYKVPADQIAYSPNSRQAFEKLPLKFFNGVQLYGLLPGEELEDLIFQEDTWKRRLYFFRRSITADTLLMLTTNYMVAIQEDLNLKVGWIVSYIPRDCIAGMQSRSGDASTQLIVQLKRQNQTMDLKFLLTEEAVNTWLTLWSRRGNPMQGYK